LSYFGLKFSNHEDIENAILELIIYRRKRQIKSYDRIKRQIIVNIKNKYDISYKM